ncbi:MAG: exo-alpha-sialidase [Gemmatimonadaceae bacterium]|nr:exo-alpha-sialidase [Gemmatimonadaceae bacterium]
MSIRSTLAATATVVLALACAGRERPAPTITAEQSPTGVDAAEPNLFALEDGRVVLSWLQRVDDSTHALKLAVRGSDGRWGETREVLRRSDLFVNWADFPSVVGLTDGRFVAHWLQRNGAGRYAYEVRMAESRDEGATWSASVTPHAAGVEAEHGFVSILPLAEGGARVFFLDGGENAMQLPASGGGHDDHESAAPMSLSTNLWGPSMGAASKVVLDTRICDCCQTSAALTAEGPVVIFRDRSDDEIRDISIVREVNGTWTTAQRVHADEWQLNACPVNGPAIVASGRTVAVAWFTGARDTAKVQLAFSTDAGATFGAPVRIDEGNPAGRVALQWLDDDAIVSWLERGNADTAYVKARRVTREGVAGAPIVVSASSGARSSGFPRMARAPEGLIFAWTMAGRPSEVRIATLRGGR